MALEKLASPIFDTGVKLLGSEMQSLRDNVIAAFAGGFIGGTLTWKDADEIYLGSSMWHHSGTTNQTVYWNSQLTKAFTGLSNSTWHYIYLDDSAIVTAGILVLTTTEITYGTTAPTYNQGRHGWYNGLDRCVGRFITDGSGNIIEESVLAISYDGWKLSLTNKTPVATTSGTSIDLGFIPAEAQRIVVKFSGVSPSGTDSLILQIGDAGGIETTGYLGTGIQTGATNLTTSLYTTGFGIKSVEAGSIIGGSVTLSLQNSSNFTWVSSVDLSLSNTAQLCIGSGTKALSAALDKLSLTSVNGVVTFDAGQITVSYE